MIVSDNLLFSKRSSGELLRGHLASVQQEVDKISKEQFQSSNNDQIISHVYSMMEITPLEIYRDKATISEPSETRFQQPGILEEVIYVDGVVMDYILPYTGESDLWKYQPSKYDNPPRGNVVPERNDDQIGVLNIKLVYSHQEFDSNHVIKEIEETLSSIDEYLSWISQDVIAHNQQLHSEISRRVKERSERLGAIQNTLKTLDIPIQRREGTPDISELPIRRRIVQPLPAQVKSEPEYGISDADYDLILNIIRQEGITFERTPITFAVHNEEGLRDILLAHLNAYFEGQATGETFRKKGKTDISIEFENRAAFVAECKLWKGDKIPPEAIDQLLGYLTWRDVKSALVIFDKDVAGFQKIQEKIPGILRNHPNCLSVEAVQGGTEWKIVLRSQEDPNRFVTVQVFLFNLFVAKSS
jgi:hypothetical protein